MRRPATTIGRRAQRGTRRGTLIAALVLLACAAGVGCGDDDASDDDAGDERAENDDSSGRSTKEDGQADDSPLTDALTASIQSSFTDQGVGDALPEDEARCAARSIVEQVGDDRLEELGVTADDAALEPVIRDTGNEAERDVIAAALGECVDLVRTLSTVYQAIGLSEDSAICVAEGIVADPDLRDTLLLGDAPEGDTVSRFDALAESCFTPEEQQLFGSSADPNTDSGTGSAPPTTGG